MLAWLGGLDPASMFLSAITIGEICKGMEKLPDSRRKEKIKSWLNDELLVRFRDQILVLDVNVMLTWGKMVARLEPTGRRLSAIDSLIAAVALAHGCSLVTRNESDFRGVGLIITNPWNAAS